uniref:Uncharacterized protein n=1 Tax=Chlamydomonas chlamydogama TaxID=225041 RepID=A0A7S2VUP2_9CHLO|mmetsp:Transcript_1672/g.3747  ORF Transcript_1672/g.3747 Transcript_1672/m.3747 type:complete len:1450 (+) Transcript_1672:116-4465(+)
MGNIRSVFLCKDVEVDWEAYVAQEWRSERSRELDKLGGIDRPPIARGDSMTAKLGYLQESLQRQGQDMERALSKRNPKADSQKVRADPSGYMLHTDLRAVERSPTMDQRQARARDRDLQQQQQEALSWAEAQEKLRQDKKAARRRMFEYARNLQLLPPLVQRPRVERRSSAGVGGLPEVLAAKHEHSSAPEISKLAGNPLDLRNLAPSKERSVAEWRMRVHRCRRRVIIVVLTVVRLQRGLKRPLRLRRVDSFSFFIPLALGEEVGKFVDEQHKYSESRAEVLQVKDAMDDVLRKKPNAAAAAAAVAAVAAAAVMLSLPAALPAAAPDLEGDDSVTSVPLPSDATPVSLPRINPRRGQSDSNVLITDPAMGALGPRVMEMRSLSARVADSSTGAADKGANARAVFASGPSLTSLVEDRPESPRTAAAARERAVARHSRSSEPSGGGAADAGNGNALLAVLNATAAAMQGTPQRRASGTGNGSFSFQQLPPLPTHRATVSGGGSRRWMGRQSENGEGGADAQQGSDYNELGPASSGSFEDSANEAAGETGAGRRAGRGSQGQGRTVGSSSAAAAGSRAAVKGPSRKVVSDGGALGQQPRRQHPMQQKQGSNRVASGSGPGERSGQRSGQHSEDGAGAAGDVTSGKRWATGVVARGGNGPPAPPPTLSEAEQLAALTSTLEGHVGQMQRCERMLSMFVNRANCSWSEQQKLVSPSVCEPREQEGFLASEEFRVYKADLARKLRAGQVVFQIYAAEDEMSLAAAASSGGALPAPGTTTCSLDLWNADPWLLVQAVRPGSMPVQEYIEGLPLGGRILTQLRLAVEALAGPEAAEKLTVLLHLHEGQQYKALGDIQNHRHYGLKRENLMVTVQHRRPGYRYNRQHKCFETDYEAARQSLGPGYGLMQLNWVGDAFTVDSAGNAVPVMGTVMELLGQRKVEWLVSLRSRDLSLCSKDAVDVPALAYTLYLRDKVRATMTVQVARTHNPSLCRQHDSIVLTRLGSNEEASPLRRSNRPVVELRSCETASSAMVDLVNQIRADSAGELTVGLQRYCFHLPSLTAALTHISTFRPKLLLRNGLVHIGLEASDLTAAPKTKCIAIRARSTAPHLLSALELEDLVPLMQAQDHDYTFRQVAASAQVQQAHLISPPTSSSSSTDSASGNGTHRRNARPGSLCIPQRIVIFCANNDATQVAVNFVATIARSRDTVHLMTVVPTSFQQQAGQQLVIHYYKQLTKMMIDTKMDVVVKGYTGLLECMESYADAVDATLIVMGSQCLTSSASMGTTLSLAMGSVTLSCLKRFTRPMAVVTANSKNISTTFRKAVPRALAVVEGHARPMLHFVCSHCLDPLRGDRLSLVQVHPTRQVTAQQQATRRHVLEAFADTAASYHMPPLQRLQLYGELDRELLPVVEDDNLHMVAVQVPNNTKGVPAPVLNLIRSCRGAVLVYRDRPGVAYP